MNITRKISSNLLVRNTLLNFIGQLVPILVAVVTIPFVVRGLGAERFGLLSLAWVILGYFTVFDLGLGRATIKYVAEALGRGYENEVANLVWTALVVQGLLGLFGGVVMIGITPCLVERLLNITPTLMKEAKIIFYLLAIALPLIFVSSSFSGLLQGGQRFDLVNSVKIPSSTLTFLLPVVGLNFDLSLSGIVALILFSRFGAFLALVYLSFRFFPKLRIFSADFTLFPKLLTYGGWVTVSSIVGPILVYLDRFMIASILSMATVAYYTAPYEIVTRLWILPTSLLLCVFPVSSRLWSKQANPELEKLFIYSVKYVLFTVSPFVLIAMLFGPEILGFWLGPDFAQKSSILFQMLAMGILINSLAHVPFHFLHGIGRPDITAKFHILEIPLYVGLLWFLVKSMGLNGAALAWSLRVGFDAMLLYGAVWKIHIVSKEMLFENSFLRSGTVLLILTGSALVVFYMDLPMLVRVVFVCLTGALFSIFTWHYALNRAEKVFFLSMLHRDRGSTEGK